MPHNGGVSQVGLWTLAFTGDFPFINMMKQAQNWSCIDNSVNVNPALFDANGFVHTIANGGVKTQFGAPSQTQRPGNYVVKWDGGGTIFRGFTATTVTGSLSSSAGTTNNRCEFSTNATVFIFGVSAVSTPGGGAGNYPTNIRVCHVDDEAALDAGDVFLPLFKSKLARIGVIRFVDWQFINESQLRLWDDDIPEGYYSYAAFYLKPSLYGGVTTNSGDDYSATFGTGGPVDGEQVILTMNASAAGDDPTLNKNGTGAIPIKYANGGNNGSNTRPIAGRNGIFTFLEDFNIWVKYGADSINLDKGLSGLPISLCLRLCKEVGAHPWFLIPYLAMDPQTDYTTELATTCKAFTDNPANDAAWMIPRFEPDNELWNGALGYFGTPMAQKKGGVHASTVWRTNWATATAYSVGDGVYYSGAVYITRKAHTSSGTYYIGSGSAWVTAHSYSINDLILATNGTTYICIVNHTSGSFSTDLAAGKWIALWEIQEDVHQWYGRVLSQVGQDVAAVYGGVGNGYQMICGVQAFGSTAASDNRLESAGYVAETGQAGNAAKHWVTHVSCANYWHSSYAGTATELTMATEYATATSARKTELINEYVSSTAGANQFTLQASMDKCLIWANWSIAKGVNGFTCYEGGYDYGYSEGSGDRQTFTRAAYFAPDLKRLTQIQYQYIDSIGEFPSLYNMSGPGDWGYGGVGETIYQTTPSTQWDGIVDYSLGKRTFRITTS